MGIWTPTSVHRELGGYFRLLMTRLGGDPHDVTFFRGVPAKLGNYSSSDPFGDSTFTVSFPQVTPFDDLSPHSEVGSWLGDFSQVDLYWIPVHSDLVSPKPYLVNPLTDQRTLDEDTGVKVWEGFVASMDIGDVSSGMNLSCQGALFQVDSFLAKPMYPPRPWPMERLIRYYLSRRTFPNLRTSKLKVRWPTGWTKVAPPKKPATAYTLSHIREGQRYTGFATRATGSWDRVLTGFIQEQLAVMWTLEDTGVEPGNQWTLLKENKRIPVLQVRDRHRTPDFELWFGTPGVDVRLNRDTTQIANIIYGEGTGTDGTEWQNAQISNDGTTTTYLPLAYKRSVWPTVNNWYFNKLHWPKEEMYKYGSGFGMDDAISSAQKSLNRDADAGWNGDLTLSVDPTQGLTRWLLKAGMTVKIKGLFGSGVTGINFHIASVDIDPNAGTASMKIDSRYRDLLNLEEAQARTRDPLTPAKMLKVGAKSVLIDDLVAPWNYTSGSGFLPKTSTKFHKNRNTGEYFPWAKWAKAHPPSTHGDWYVRVNANARLSADRWTFLTPSGVGGLYMGQKGAIRRSEIVCFDKNGNILKIPFHVGIYQGVDINENDMPYEGTNFDPFTPGFFEEIDDEGSPKDPGNYSVGAKQDRIVAWGNSEQKAGYSPGRSSDDDLPTGLLVDEGQWSWDFQALNPGTFGEMVEIGSVPKVELMLSVAIYADTTDLEDVAPQDAYFIGRFYRANPGS